MSSADQIQIMSVEELADDVGAECEGHAAVVLAPALHVLVGVRPQQVAQQTCNYTLSFIMEIQSFYYYNGENLYR